MNNRKSEEIQRQVLELGAAGVPQRNIAEMTGISRSTVFGILRIGRVVRTRKTCTYPGPRCQRCGGALPCLTCAREVRATSGSMGKDPPIDYESELEFSAEVREATLKIQAAWSPEEERNRAGVRVVGDYAPVRTF